MVCFKENFKGGMEEQRDLGAKFWRLVINV